MDNNNTKEELLTEIAKLKNELTAVSRTLTEAQSSLKQALTELNIYENYNYKEAVCQDCVDAINEYITYGTLPHSLPSWCSSMSEFLIDYLRSESNVTGNGNGSYTCSTYVAEKYLCHNWTLVSELLDEGYITITKDTYLEEIDVAVRDYLVSEVVEEALEQSLYTDEWLWDFIDWRDSDEVQALLKKNEGYEFFDVSWGEKELSKLNIDSSYLVIKAKNGLCDIILSPKKSEEQ